MFQFSLSKDERVLTISNAAGASIQVIVSDIPLAIQHFEGHKEIYKNDPHAINSLNAEIEKYNGYQFEVDKIRGIKPTVKKDPKPATKKAISKVEKITPVVKKKITPKKK